MNQIHEVKPRETIGRDTTNRFRMQFQAAAFAALEILEGKDVDRIYCDYHDDFVVRRTVAGVVEYHFFQVKTKGRLNQQWNLGEVFSLKKKGKLEDQASLEAINKSIAGRLFLHAIQFGESCREVTLLSNVHFHDDVYEVQQHLKNGISTKPHITQLIVKFADIFSPSKPLTEAQIDAARSKLTLTQASYLGDTLEPFSDAARNAIWKFSEIDLHKHEVDEIASSLIGLVEMKSCSPISELANDELDKSTGISLDDLLKVLSISTVVYENLLQGDDPSVIKAASILQRQLKTAGAPDNMIELASRAKVNWDVWLRTARHTYPEFDLELLLANIDDKCKVWILSGCKLIDLQLVMTNFLASDLAKKFSSLDSDLVFGSFCAGIVRRASK